jgi:hypothetical protein
VEVLPILSYERRTEIGAAGQNSRVFKVFDNHLHAELVVKEVEKKRLGDPARYFTEARAVHAAAHPRVVPVLWAGCSRAEDRDEARSRQPSRVLQGARSDLVPLSTRSSPPRAITRTIGP